MRGSVGCKQSGSSSGSARHDVHRSSHLASHLLRPLSTSCRHEKQLLRSRGIQDHGFPGRLTALRQSMPLSSVATSQKAGNRAPSVGMVDPQMSSLRKLVLDENGDPDVQVKFSLKYRTNYGQQVKILGSHPKLGAWDISKALALHWTDGDQWTATLDLPAGSIYEYKYVVVEHGTNNALDWQSGSNSLLAVQSEERTVAVSDNWTNAPGAQVTADGSTLTRENKLQKWAGEMRAYRQEAKKLQIEVARKTDEMQATKAQVARLRMELSMSIRGKEEAEVKVQALEQENAVLKAEVVQAQVSMQSMMAEAIKLLADEMGLNDDETFVDGVEEDEDAEEYEEGEEYEDEDELVAAAHEVDESEAEDEVAGPLAAHSVEPAVSHASSNGSASGSQGGSGNNHKAEKPVPSFGGASSSQQSESPVERFGAWLGKRNAAPAQSNGTSWSTSTGNVGPAEKEPSSSLQQPTKSDWRATIQRHSD